MQKEAVRNDSAISLTVNGERKQLRARTLRELLAELEFEGSFFAIAVNREVVARERWDEPLLRNSDSIEIVTPRQGG
jgi:sulfur carrier protein